MFAFNLSLSDVFAFAWSARCPQTWFSTWSLAKAWRAPGFGVWSSSFRFQSSRALMHPACGGQLSRQVADGFFQLAIWVSWRRVRVARRSDGVPAPAGGIACRACLVVEAWSRERVFYGFSRTRVASLEFDGRVGFGFLLGSGGPALRTRRDFAPPYDGLGAGLQFPVALASVVIAQFSFFGYQAFVQTAITEGRRSFLER